MSALYARTFFVRDGRLAWDVGWIGVVEGATVVRCFRHRPTLTSYFRCSLTS